MAESVLDLFAKLTLDSSEYERGLVGAENKASSFGGRFKNAVGTAAKIGATAIAAVGTATVAIGKQALDTYADYEQLSGGIETLYGEHSAAAETMMENASQAWRTAGMSANEYMETAIQSSAALISSLGGDTEEAAKLMDMSIVDMSDNVNKMGTTMEAVQNAYRGFSRGNFTMLDNLALGYAGTKEGMQQLLDKAKELEAQQGRTTEFSIESYSDIVQAIHVVQGSMGIAGTTSKEASETISGSVSAIKSAWSNLLVGIADDNANIPELVDQLIKSITTVGQNTIPRIKVILNGAVKVITEVSKQILPMVVQVIVDNLPVLVEGAVQIIQTLGKAVIDNLPQLIDAGLQIILTLADALVQALPEIIPAVVQTILIIVEKLTDPDTIIQLVDAAFKILGALAEGLIKAIPELIKAIPQIIKNLIEALIRCFPQLVESGKELLGKMKEGIMQAFPDLKTKVSEGLNKLKTKASETWDNIKRDASSKWTSVKTTVANVWDDIKTAVSNRANTLVDNIKSKFDQAKETIKNAVERFKSLMNFHWSLPKLKLPHISISGHFSIKPPSTPHFSVEWYRKAYDNPYLFTQPTVFGNKGFGDGNGGEIVYGHENLMRDIAEAMRGAVGDLVANIPPVNITSIVELDGTVLARKMYSYNQSEINRHGSSLVKA